MVFACLAVAVVLQGLSTVILVAERAIDDESVGRTRLSEKDSALADIRQMLLRSWEPIAPVWSEAEESEGGGATESWVEEVPESDGWLMRATVRHEPTLSRLVVSASLERGRDGLDLPLAAVVGGTMTASPDRESPWIDSEGAGEPEETGPSASMVPCYFSDVPVDPLLACTCVVESLVTPWRLDPGWLALTSADSSPVSFGDDVLCLGGGTAGWFGGNVALPSECGGTAPDSPVLVVVTGGADLDARDRGDLYGVIVVDEGSVLLEGTVLHGAVFATEEVALGQTGQILFSPQIFRWATDRSLHRVRLVPGTRWEGLE